MPEPETTPFMKDVTWWLKLHGILFGFITFALMMAALAGCVLCPSMDDNCWLMRTMNGESDGNGRMTPEEACTGRGGTAILKTGEFDRCSDGQ